MSTSDLELRNAALIRLRKKREFLRHATAYGLVNLGLGLVWLLNTPHAFYWPLFPLLGWGVGLTLHGLGTYLPAPARRVSSARCADWPTGRRAAPAAANTAAGSASVVVRPAWQA